eukprot:372728_1
MLNYAVITIMVVMSTIFTPTHCIYNCSTAYACMGETINTVDIVYGEGYQSLNGATIVTTKYIHCQGAFSCHNTHSLSSSSVAYCEGENSCTNSASIDAHSGLYCEGSLSCVHANITSKERVHCRGAYSCANSQIQLDHKSTVNTVQSSIYGYGAYSLQNVIIFSTNNSEIFLHGYQAGFGGTMYCQTDHICTINCKANGCAMFYVQCDGICTINSHSNDTVAPITNPVAYNRSMADFLHVYDTTDDACTEQQEFTFDNGRQNVNENSNDIVHNTQNGDHICCRGSRSCSGINNIITSDESVVCSGWWSCFNSVEMMTINSQNGSIYCAGEEACRYANIVTPNNVYCSSHGGCRDTMIVGADNVFCIGKISCKSSNILSSGDMNVYLLGTESGYGAKITCKVGDNCFVLCGGGDSCVDAIVECNGLCTVQCSNDTGCPLQVTFSPTVLPSYQPTPMSYNPSMSPSTTITESRSYGTQPLIVTMSSTIVQIVSSLNDETSHVASVYRLPADLLVASFIVLILLIGVCIVNTCIKRCKAAKRQKQSYKISDDMVHIVHSNVINTEMTDIQKGNHEDTHIINNQIKAAADGTVYQKGESFEIIGDDETPMDCIRDGTQITVEGV